jgi:protein Tex
MGLRGSSWIYGSRWIYIDALVGIAERVALNVVAHRDKYGRFRSRKQLNKVPGIGAKTYEQAAGFLRIRDGENPLDCTAVHPESYPVVEQIARSLDTPVAELIANPQLLTKVDACQIDAGAFTVKDILEELRKPGRDPREQFVAPNFNEKVREFADVQPEMILEGVVTNVTKFGAFVDIGVHQDGLVHISELSNRFIKDPSEAVKAGQIVKVKVLSADAKTKRIALSMKALMGPTPKNSRPNSPQPVPKPHPSLNEKLAMLSTKWKVS